MYLLFETDYTTDGERKEAAEKSECASCHQEVATAETVRFGGRCLCFSCASFDDE